MAQSNLRIQLVLFGVVFCVLSYAAYPCNVPAFRYALERWPADLYQVVVYHDSAPAGEEFKLLAKNAVGHGGLANYSLRTVDITTPEGKALAGGRKIAAYPWVEILYPTHSQVQGVVWSGSLAGRAKKIFESRSRSALAEKLLGGDVAVWILVRSGQETKDRRALNSLRTALEKASATLRIPEIGTDQNGDPVVVSDFKTYPVHFALMEIARDDPDEELLVNGLLKSEPDLQHFDEPMAFPVFGRGRALYALVGDGIQEANILEACQSLMNWCSCEIKAQNPGTDLLVAADWSRPYGGKMVEDPDLPLTGLSSFVPDKSAAANGKLTSNADAVKTSAPAACPIAPPAAKPASSVAAKSATSEGSRNMLTRNVLYLAGGAGLVLLALSVVVAVKKRR
ncbi:MAG: hypothetical protein EHM18_01450 [Acidobacteria bacterium]|nr:MAG: hypothetical protein EHM18_01450 [Acidobacteriota bacterium]